MTPAIDYLNPDLPPDLRIVPMPVIDATAESLEGYGRLVTRPEDCQIEIVRWPATGWRPVDADTGDEAGTTEGIFVSEWKGDILYGRNDAVGGHYILAYATEPQLADQQHHKPPERMLLWHANYHPDVTAVFSAAEAALPGAAGPAGRRHHARQVRLLSL